MLRTVKDACQLHPMALDYVMGEQIENLSDVIERTAADAREFFDKNFVTKGMEMLLSQGLKRLAGRIRRSLNSSRPWAAGRRTR
jgi:hypothetical protein